ncbi:MAG: hypothetical protein EKK34_02945 [Mycobacterium sp.]|nr:MAG: hypothetical protein EKK34_02945 [Mycobacterium sp.]
MERKTPKKVVVSKAAVKRSGVRATKASAKLEGRVVLNRPGSAGDSGYWIPISGWSVRCAS